MRVGTLSYFVGNVMESARQKFSKIAAKVKSVASIQFDLKKMIHLKPGHDPFKGGDWIHFNSLVKLVREKANYTFTVPKIVLELDPAEFYKQALQPAFRFLCETVQAHAAEIILTVASTQVRASDSITLSKGEVLELCT